MPYKVFLVEDEIVTREGIRDNVNWAAAGFEFCGEASDGEIALPLIQALRPDVLITDIKMPFMDGLQLCSIVKESMPAVKIIILSGHDEFHYAQQAIKLGVTEYLLKPLTAQDLSAVLHKVARLIDSERADQASVEGLRSQLENNLSLLREKFLLQLVTGSVSSGEALVTSRQLKIDLLARWYLVAVLKAELREDGDAPGYAEYQSTEKIIAGLIDPNPDIISFKKDLEEIVLILKGEQVTQLEQDSFMLGQLLKEEVEGKTRCLLTIGLGRPTERIGNLPQSFAEALAQVQDPAPALATSSGNNQLPKLDDVVIEEYLKYGVKADFDAFFERYIQPLGGRSLKSRIFIEYIFISGALAAAKFVESLSGNADQLLPGLQRLEELSLKMKTVDQAKAALEKMITAALDFRDSQTHRQSTSLINKAKAYIDANYASPDISLNSVAAHVNLSPSHFSVVFGRETGENFIEYLTQRRIKKAMELLRTTALRSSEIAYTVGYNDPHYFSSAFRKATGLTPTEFRQQSQAGKAIG